MSEPNEQHESDYECPGCHQQYAGPWSLDNHVQKCQKVPLAHDRCRECGQPGCNGECFGDDMMGASS